MSLGVDISQYNEKINFSILKNNVKFVMIRAGLGHMIPDKMFKSNILNCNSFHIPCGVYWFSYALNKDEAIQEAKYCIETIKPHDIILPVAYDFEYDSERYAKEQGVIFTNSDRQEIIDAFCQEIDKAGYTPMVYTNSDYWKYKGTSYFKNIYDIWFAWYSDPLPKNFNCEIWQYSCQGKVSGINTSVDMDVCYKDYVKIYSDKKLNEFSETWFEYYFDFDKNPKSIENYKTAITQIMRKENEDSKIEIARKYLCDYNLLCFIIKKMKERKEQWQY